MAVQTMAIEEKSEEDLFHTRSVWPVVKQSKASGLPVPKFVSRSMQLPTFLKKSSSVVKPEISFEDLLKHQVHIENADYESSELEASTPSFYKASNDDNLGELELAVSSIAAYIEHADHFLGMFQMKGM